MLVHAYQHAIIYLLYINFDFFTLCVAHVLFDITSLGDREANTYTFALLRYKCYYVSYIYVGVSKKPDTDA